MRVRKKMTKKRGKNELGKKKKKNRKEGRKAHTHEFGLGGNILFFIRIRNPLLQDRFIIRVLKDVLRPLKGQVYIRSTCGRARNGRWGNYH